MTKTLGVPVVLGLVVLSSCSEPDVVAPDPMTPLFTTAPHDPANCQTGPILRCRTVWVDVSLLDRTRVPGTGLRINLFDDVVLDAAVSYNDKSDLGSDYRHWGADIVGSQGQGTASILFSTSRARATGAVRLPRSYPWSHFTVRPVPGRSGFHVVEEIDPNHEPPLAM